MFEFRVLGPLEARGANGNVALGGRKQSLVLAILLLRAGEFVTREALIDTVWPEAPPPSAVATLESYVSRLRRTLRAAGADGKVIQSGRGGYRLTPNGNQIDLQQFERLAAAARASLQHGSAAEAAGQADAALSLWRGPALAGLCEQPGLRADAAALEDRRAEALETFAESALRCGRDREVITRLSTEVARYPARERLRALLMLALYRAGRQADALQAYQDARRYLVGKLGLEPEPALRELQDRILRHDPSLDDRQDPELERQRPEHHAEPAGAPAVARTAGRTRWRPTAIGGLAAAAVVAALVIASGGGSNTQALAGLSGASGRDGSDRLVWRAFSRGPGCMT